MSPFEASSADWEKMLWAGVGAGLLGSSGPQGMDLGRVKIGERKKKERKKNQMK